jgi:hypothetical protein
MPLVTPAIFSRSLALPIALAQTELRRGKQIQIMQFDLKSGQLLELRCLNLHLIKVLTPGVIPDYINRSLGLASVGVYEGSMLTGAVALVKGLQVGVSQFNQWSVRRFISPGSYEVVISNNTRNIDVSVVVTGTLKVYTA